MSTIVNTNIAALNSQRSLKVVSEQSGKASEKLSSGLRINRAGDDAAGLAISEKMRSQIRGLNTASRNSQDGISLIQTAEGALQESHDMLQRMRELVVQASNGTNTKEDRTKIALELNELSDELTSVSEKTEFNRKKLVNGDLAGNQITLQTGANSNQIMSFNIAKMDSDTLGVPKSAIGGLVASGDALDDVAGGAATTAVSLADGDTDIVLDGTVANYGTFDFGNGQSISIDKKSGVTISGFGKQDGVFTKAEFAAKFINGDTFYATSGAKVEIPALVDWAAADEPEITITAAEAATDVDDNDIDAAKDITSKDTNSAKTSKLYGFDNTFITGYTGDTASTLEFVSFDGVSLDQITGVTNDIAKKIASGEKIAVGSIGSLVLHSKDGTAQHAFTGTNSDYTNGGQLVRHSADGTTVSAQSMGKILTKVDAAIESVSAQRAKLGAYQNRLEHTIKNLDTSSENLSASESRIRDTDMAKEMMNFTRSNVLTQAAQSMLAQANQAPNNVLSLLR